MGVVFGLAAAIWWGVGDFVIPTLARYMGSTKSLLYIQIFSLLSWLVLIPVFPHDSKGGPNIWAIAVAAGVFHVGGLVLTYKAFEIGTLSLVSPIASSFAIVTAFLTLVFGPQPPAMALAGTVLLVAGVAVVSRSTGSEGPVSIKGVPQAVGSAIAFGVMFWIIDFYVQKPLGYVYPLIVLKIMASSYAFLMAGLARRRGVEEEVQPTKRNVWGLAVLAALLDSGAWVAWLFGNREANTAVVTALASLFSAVTVVMAWIFLKERLNRFQWVGVAVILAGILLVSLP